MEDFNNLWPAGLFLITYTGLIFGGFNWMLKNQTKQINIKFDQIDAKFDQVNEKIEQTSATIEPIINAKIEPINAKMEQINEKLDNHITDTNKKIDNLSNRIDDTNKKIENLSNHFDLRFDRLYELLLQNKKTG